MNLEEFDEALKKVPTHEVAGGRIVQVGEDVWFGLMNRLDNLQRENKQLKRRVEDMRRTIIDMRR